MKNRLLQSRLLAVAISAVATAACAGQPAAAPQAISLVQLIADPQQYVGRQVHVIGYLGRAPNLFLFLTRDHYQASDVMSAISVVDMTENASLIQSACLQHYVAVIGTVIKRDDPVFYELAHVQQVGLQEDPAICWTSQKGKDAR
jgi:hypothetical protein